MLRIEQAGSASAAAAGCAVQPWADRAPGGGAGRARRARLRDALHEDLTGLEVPRVMYGAA